MNLASKAVVRWFLSRKTDDTEEIENFLAVLERGITKGQENSRSLLTGFLGNALAEAQSEVDQDDIEQLVLLHFKLEELSKQEQEVIAMQEIRKIVELPPATGLQARIRSSGLAKQLGRITDIRK